MLAVNPVYVVEFIVNTPEVAFPTIGTVFLAVTGAEALYADLGHFGRKPIVTAWMWIVFPCLLLNYFGQGAFILANGGTSANPFFEMFPRDWALLPMVLLATMATVIASQAVISGAYSLIAAGGATQSSAAPQHRAYVGKQSGQVYLPRVNVLLGLVVILLVLGFERSIQSRVGIWYSGDRQHAGHDDAAFHRHEPDLEVALVGCGAADCCAS